MHKITIAIIGSGIFLGFANLGVAQARWMQTDPIGYEDQMNLYAYVHNDPINMVDPNGEDAILVHELDGSRTIVVPFSLRGSNVTPTTASDMESIAAGWTVDGGNESFQAIHTTVPIEGILNDVEIGSGPNTSMCGSAGECTNRLGGDRVYINGDNNMSTEAAVHDAVGHGSGMQDGYIEGPRDAHGNRTSVPKPGYTSDNAMTTRGGNRVTQSQIREVERNSTTIERCRTPEGGLKTC